MNSNYIEILLSTYNGAEFLEEQIKSILNQTYKNWILTVRDDGSSDSTMEILKFYSHKMLEKIKIYEEKEHLGVCQSFNKLMLSATGDYIMFCDQDDIWLPYKIEISYRKILELEDRYNKETPILVFSDMIVGDSNGRIINKSYWKYSNLPYKRLDYRYFLFRNTASGNTIIMNKSAVNLCSPIPKCAILHDWWCTLVVSVFGIVDYIPIPTLIYRQHGKNDLGARKWSFTSALKKLNDLEGFIKNLDKSINQAECFLQTYSSKLESRTKKTIEQFINIKKLHKIHRIYFLLTHGFVSLNIRDLGALIFRWIRF